VRCSWRRHASNIEVVTARWPKPAWFTADEAIQDDANPVAVLWDLWTHPRYGLGLPEISLNVAELYTAAEILASKGRGVLPVIKRPMTFRDLRPRLCECFDGYTTHDSQERGWAWPWFAPAARLWRPWRKPTWSTRPASNRRAGMTHTRRRSSGSPTGPNGSRRRPSPGVNGRYSAAKCCGSGSGRRVAAGPRWKKTPEILNRLRALLQEDTAGDPMGRRGLWTGKRLRDISEELAHLGLRVCPNTVRRLLAEVDYALHANRKSLSANSGPWRDQQFQLLNLQRHEFTRSAYPIISVDTKKKELVGQFKNHGRVWSRDPILVQDHDFRSQAKGLARGVDAFLEFS
jgi:hypothetical protein